MSEYELLQAFRNERSEEAFAELVRRFAGMVYSVAKRRLANASLAEDITQLVFIRLAKAPPKARTHSHLAAWLHRTTLNVTIDACRAETRRQAREQHALAMEPATTENAVWEEISPKLDEALDQLPNEDRQALLLRFFGRMTMRHVGEALGVSEDAAKMRVSRAVGRLRTKLGADGTACTAVVFSTILGERSVEAAPDQMVSRLAAMRLPAAAGAAGIGGLIAALGRSAKFNPALTAAMVVVMIGVGAVKLDRALTPPVSQVAMDPEADLTDKAVRIANRRSFDADGFNAFAAPPPKLAKMFLHVMDSETGGPLAGADIHFAYFGAGGLDESHEMATENDGVATVPEPDDSSKTNGMNVWAAARGHVPRSVPFRDGKIPADYTMRLETSRTAGGLVVNLQGLPVGGVSIAIQNPPNKRGDAAHVDFHYCPATSRDDGSWSFNYLPKDETNEIRFIQKKQGYAPTFLVVPASRVSLTSLVLVINRGFNVTGQITDGQHHAIANARITTIDGDRRRRLAASSDENGVFLLAGVPEDSISYAKEPALETNAGGGVVIRGFTEQGSSQVELAVMAEGFAPQSKTVQLAGATNAVDFALSPGKIFRGRVLDEFGRPVPNAVIRTDFDFKNQMARRFDWISRSDADGRFEWDSAPAEQICYWFEADGYDPVRGLPLAADGGGHEITLKSNTVKTK